MKQSTFDYKPDEPEKKPRQNTGPHPDPMEAAVHEGEIMPAEPATGTELIVIDPKDTAIITAFSADKGLDPLIDKIKKRVESQVLDVTTEKGRARIGSIAREIGSAKMGLKRMALDLTEDWRTKTKNVTSETSRMEAELDALRDKVLAPRVEFETREKERVDGHRQRLDQLAGLSSFQDPDYPPTSAAVQARIDRLADFKEVDWQEFTESAKAAKDKVEMTLSDMLVRLKKAEADALELSLLRIEQEKQQKIWDDMYADAHTDNVAFDAAAKAKKDAEEEAERQRVAREAEIQKEKDAAAERTRIEKERTDKIEKDRVAGHDAALRQIAGMVVFDKPPSSADVQARIDILTKKDERDWQEFLEDSVDARNTVLKNLSDMRDDIKKSEVAAKKIADAEAERIQKEAEDAAAEKARKKIADDAEAERKAAAAREADTKHKAKINNEALLVLVNLLDNDNSPEAVAKTIIVAIAKGEIPHISIKY